MNAEGKSEPRELAGALTEGEELGAAEQQPAAEPEAAPAAVETPEVADIEALKAEAAKAKEHWDRLLRATADFENFKKRAARERQEAIKFGNESLLEKLIPVLDNFDMALAAVNTAPSGAAQSFQTGLAMMYQQLKRVLTEAGLEELEDATNQPFDPKVHEAVSQIESAQVPEGNVLQQLRKGYKLRERLIRPAGVIVAKTPAAQS